MSQFESEKGQMEKDRVEKVQVRCMENNQGSSWCVTAFSLIDVFRFAHTTHAQTLNARTSFVGTQAHTRGKTMNRFSPRPLALSFRQSANREVSTRERDYA